jgi:hypothetical protein
MQDLRQRLQAQMEALKQEIAQLEAAAAALGPITSRRPGHRASASASNDPAVSRKRASRGPRRRSGNRKRLSVEQREEQVRSVVRNTPGLKVSELSRQMGISAPRAHQLVKPMLERRELRKTDGGLSLAARAKGKSA